MRFLATSLVLSLVCLLLASSGASLVARLRVASAQTTLSTRWLPAQTKTAALQSAYIDEETGERGFLLTGSPVFLEPYTLGHQDAGRLEGQLQSLLATDAAARTMLRQVVAAHRSWEREVAIPEMAARRAGPIPQAQVDAMALSGKQSFDALRARLDSLLERTSTLTSHELASISGAQVVADVVTAVTVVLALLVAALAIPVTRRVLTRPLDRLLGQLQSVAGGEYRNSIGTGGAAELVLMASSAEQMRQSLLRHSDELVRAQRALTLRSERDRLAADLHDRSIQRIFALGLSLTSLAKRNPAQAPAINPLVDETDRSIRELRAIVFNLSHEGKTSLRNGVDQVIRESARVLGFAPELEVRGPVDQVVDEDLTAEFLSVLREALSNVLRHARASKVDVRITAGDRLHLLVSDDGIGLSPGSQGYGVRNIQARAARFGGEAQLRNRAEGGTTLEWSVPLAG